jgi:hypothetical protein
VKPALGDTGRCEVCGGKIVLVKHPRIISLSLALWVHSGALRRATALHAAVGPS